MNMSTKVNGQSIRRSGLALGFQRPVNRTGSPQVDSMALCDLERIKTVYQVCSDACLIPDFG